MPGGHESAPYRPELPLIVAEFSFHSTPACFFLSSFFFLRNWHKGTLGGKIKLFDCLTLIQKSILTCCFKVKTQIKKCNIVNSPLIASLMLLEITTFMGIITFLKKKQLFST